MSFNTPELPLFTLLDVEKAFPIEGRAAPHQKAAMDGIRLTLKAGQSAGAGGRETDRANRPWCG